MSDAEIWLEANRAATAEQLFDYDADPEGKDSELLRQFLKPRLSIKERRSAGKELRKRVPRRSHAEFTPSETRSDPVSILEEQAKTRLPMFVPIRYARMLVSPFAFLRGSAAVMAADLAGTPTTGIRVQACGDMHVSNFGIFGSAERNLVFGINDFDETLPGPWEWDLKRLAASAVVAARFMGGDRNETEKVARDVASEYRKRIDEYAEMGYLEVWYAAIREQAVLDGVSPDTRKHVEALLDKARKRTNLQVLDKLTDLVDDQHQIREERPYIIRETHSADGQPIREILDVFLHRYMASLMEDRKQLLSRYQIIDVARKVVGVGSVGTRCWVILLLGNTNGDPLFLQVKEAQPSVLQPYCEKSKYQYEGRRVVVGQRLIQGAPDIFLGWGTIEQTHFYVRQLRDLKGSVTFNENDALPSAFGEYCELCGWALALAHAKSGDAAMISGYLGKSDSMDEAISKFAHAYADQTERDYEALVRAKAEGRIVVAAEEES